MVEILVTSFCHRLKDEIDVCNPELASRMNMLDPHVSDSDGPTCHLHIASYGYGIANRVLSASAHSGLHTLGVLPSRSYSRWPPNP